MSQGMPKKRVARGGRPKASSMDPFVPVRGERVLVALRHADGGPISVNNAAARLRAAGTPISGPSLNDIVLGATRTTRRSIRDGIAKLANGELDGPFSSAWLGG